MIRQFLARQQRLAGVVPDDRTILIEAFPDQTGELGLAILTPFGGTLHLGLKLALLGRIRRRLGLTPACLHGDDGLLFRLPNLDEPPLDLFDGLTGELAENLIREELPDTALFGLRFRQNASRALLMPRPDPAKRTPLWLQRLRAKDLLQVARQFPDFPIVLETFRECLDDDLDLPRLRAFLDAIQEGSIRVVRRRAEVPSPLTSELIFAFTAAHVYEWDQPKSSARQPAASVVDEDLLGPLLRDGASSRWLDPQAIGRVDNRLRRLGHPPRTAEEMSEHLRRLGDLTTAELSGPMAAFLAELQASGRALTIELTGTSEPLRWILTEDVSLYQEAFPGALGGAVPHGSERASPSLPATNARMTIVERFLRTHALIGLADLTARYPISPPEATELLEHWAEEGKAIRLDGRDGSEEARWAERDNLAEIRRATVAARRRESLAVSPETFADFLLRWQHVHPSTRGEGPAFVETVLQQLQGYAMPARLWESEVFPRHVEGYRPAWLDEVLNRGSWLWRSARGLESSDERKPVDGEPRVAFFLRDFPGQTEGTRELGDLSDDEARVLGLLDREGAAVRVRPGADLGHRADAGAPRAAGPVGPGTGDERPLRSGAPGAESALLALTEAASDRRGGHLLRIRPRRSIAGQPEGRWSRLADSANDPEGQLLAWAGALLERYGVLTREIAALDRSAPTWSDIAPILARAEWRDEVRRGYFVEGLSGVQYATEEAAAELGRLSAQSPAVTPVILVSTIDPANLYGAGAPLDVELLDGGVARLPRIAGNFLAIRDGRPVLIVEAYGKRLTGLPWASQTDIDSALKLLTTLTGPARRILKVELYNSVPAAESPAAARLTEAGFVRDYPAMAYYAGWPTIPAGAT